MRVLKVLLLTTFLSFMNDAIVFSQQTKEIVSRVTTFGVIPLNNVQITAVKSGEVTYTDSLGRFKINSLEKDAIKLSASGFDDIKIRTNKFGQSQINLVFSNTHNSFDEAVSNGHIRKELLEGAIIKYPLKGDKDYSRYNSIYNLIDNEIYNVNVNGTSVTTNKPNSFTQSQEVLYVVDGMTVSDVAFVIPLNVKAIRYVDGPEAARYGSQGANGAIEITLKKN